MLIPKFPVPHAPVPHAPAPQYPTSAIPNTPPPSVMPPDAKIEVPMPAPPKEATVLATGIDVRSPGAIPVREYDTRVYRVPEGTLDFSEISKKFYHSDKYAKALLEYNRTSPQANETLRQDPPRLLPGQVVLIPPTYILENKHSQDIQEFKLGTPTPISAISTAPVAQPTPVPVAASPAAPKADSYVASGARTYRVQGNGESILQVSRNALGNVSRWNEIWRLNGHLNPEQLIPAGTVVMLP